LLVHFGDENFLERYHGYQAHLAEWRQQYPRLAAVDARYDTQFVLEMTPGKDGSAEKAATDAATSASSVKSDTAPPAKKPLAAPHKTASKHTKARASVKSARQLTLQQLRQQRQMEQR
jgi:cell division protein FtsQ